MGHLAALSFHETKSIISGEGGALLVNDARFAERARIIREKGTDRERFLKGETAFYTWVDIGSSYLPSDLIAAFLLAQLEDAPSIIERRRALWERYHAAFEGLERSALARRPSVPAEVRHNGHMYHLMLRDQGQRDRFIRETAARGIMTVFHYIPLHESPAGKKFGRVSGSLEHTSAVSRQIVRLPLWAGLDDRIESVIAAVNEIVPAL
jgi:dTDP-4-amino-4,6-dideoxygalactose transaminase